MFVRIWSTSLRLLYTHFTPFLISSEISEKEDGVESSLIFSDVEIMGYLGLDT